MANIDALTKLKNVFESGNSTLDKINATIKNDTYPSKPCPDDKPVFNGTECFTCNATTEYYDLAKKKCVKPELGPNIAALTALKNVYPSGNATLDKLQAAIKNSSVPIKACPDDKPVYNGTACFSCNKTMFYDLANKKCIKSRSVDNVTALKTLKNVY